MGKLMNLTDRTFDMLTVIKGLRTENQAVLCGCAGVSAAIPLSCPLQICYEPMVQNHAVVFGILPLPPSLI